MHEELSFKAKFKNVCDNEHVNVFINTLWLGRCEFKIGEFLGLHLAMDSSAESLVGGQSPATAATAVGCRFAKGWFRVSPLLSFPSHSLSLRSCSFLYGHFTRCVIQLLLKLVLQRNGGATAPAFRRQPLLRRLLVHHWLGKIWKT